MEIVIHGHESTTELLAVKAAIEVLIAKPASEDGKVIAEVDDRVEVPAIPEPKSQTIPEVAADPGISDMSIPAPPAIPAAQLEVSDLTDSGDPAATPAPERDKHGRIWDARIDSSNKKQTTNGEWMKRKNVDDAIRQQVMAELTAADTAAPAEVFTPPVAPVDTSAPPPPPVVAGDAVAPSAIDWGVVFTRTMTAKTAELVNQEQIDAKVLEYGIVGGFPALIARPDLYEKFLVELSIA